MLYGFIRGQLGRYAGHCVDIVHTLRLSHYCGLSPSSPANIYHLLVLDDLFKSTPSRFLVFFCCLCGWKVLPNETSALWGEYMHRVFLTEVISTSEKDNSYSWTSVRKKNSMYQQIAQSFKVWRKNNKSYRSWNCFKISFLVSIITD